MSAWNCETRAALTKGLYEGERLNALRSLHNPLESARGYGHGWTCAHSPHLPCPELSMPQTPNPTTANRDARSFFVAVTWLATELANGFGLPGPIAREQRQGHM